MENFFPLACTNANANPLLVDDDGYLRDGWARLDELAGRARVPLDLFDFGSTGDADSTPALTAGSIAASLSTPPGDEDEDFDEQDGQRSDASFDEGEENDALFEDEECDAPFEDGENAEEEHADNEWPEERYDDDEEPEIGRQETTDMEQAQKPTPEQVEAEGASTDVDAYDAGTSADPTTSVAQSRAMANHATPSTSGTRGRKRRADEEQAEVEDSKRQRLAQPAPGYSGGQMAAFSGPFSDMHLAMATPPAVHAANGTPMNAPGDLAPLRPEDAAGLQRPDASAEVESQRSEEAEYEEEAEPPAEITRAWRRKKKSSSAPGNGQPAQKHNNKRTRPYRAYEALRRAHADALKAEARRILELPEDTPASALPAPKTLTEDLKDELREIGPGTTGRVISNTAGYIVCAICKEDFDLDRELVINEDWAIERHIKEYHSNAACSACGMPVAARDVKAFRRHRAVCPVWYALVKSGWHWAWMVEHGLVRADVDEMNAEFFVKREKDAARRAGDTVGCLEEIMKGGEIAELTDILDKFLKRLGLDGVQRAVAKQDTADGGPVAGPSRHADSRPL